MTREAILQVRGVSVRFGGVVALDDVSFEVEEGAICGVIGPNGAGKTTMFNCLTRLYTYEQGDIVFEGRSLRALPAHRIAHLGIARTFQNLALFHTMTVLDNVTLGTHCRARTGYVTNMLRLPAAAAEEEEMLEAARRLLHDFGLGEVASRRVVDLPFGTRKRVEFARALASRPKLLLLDEPAGGLNHEEVEDLRTIIRGVRDAYGVTILLVEHHMNLVMSLSDKVVVLDFGRKIGDGRPDEIQHDERIIRAYLG